MIYLLLAAAASGPFSFEVYGVLGVVVAALLTGVLWAKPSVDRLIRDKDQAVERLLKDKGKAEEQRDAMSAVLTDKVLPALIESNQLMTGLKPVLEDAVRELRRRT